MCPPDALLPEDISEELPEVQFKLIVRPDGKNVVDEDGTFPPGMIDFSKEGHLRNVIDRYEPIGSGGDLKQVAIQTYFLAKPVSDIEIYYSPPRDTEALANALEEFFFVYLDRSPRLHQSPSEFNGSVFFSRFRTLIEVVKNQVDLSDTNGDLAGILYGYDPINVAGYLVTRPTCPRDLFK